MNMVRKKSIYTIALFAWGLVVFGATVAVFSGRAAPTVTPDMLPIDGPFGMFAFAAVPLLAGGAVIGLLKRRAWRRAGQRANLTPEGGGVFGTPTLAGTVNGRPVRARTIKRRTGGGGEGGSNKSTFTIIEADLDDHATDGLVIGAGDGDVPGFSDMPVDIEAESVEGFAVVGTSDELAGETLTTRARNQLRQPALLDSVLVGNASDVLLEAVPDSDGFLAGKLTDGIEQKLQEELAGDAGTVRAETSGLILDSEELANQITAVATVADEFESATTQ